MYEDIVESLRRSPVIEKNGYSYFVHPLSNGVPSTDPGMIDAVASWMVEVGDLRCDLILAPESMGIPFAVAVSMKTGVPYSVIRKSPTELPGEVEIVQRTGYSKSSMFINGLREGIRVAIIDDVVSTGGTLSAILGALEMSKAAVTDVLIVVNKDGGASRFADSPVKVKTLFDLSVVDGRVEAGLSGASETGAD